MKMTFAFIGALILLFLSLGLGSVDIPFSTITHVILHNLSPETFTQTFSEMDQTLIWELRFPRVILALLAGAGLTLVGHILQTLVNNPLADPHLLGLSSGASLGSVVGLFFAPFLPFALTVQACSFLGALLALLFLLLISAHKGNMPSERLILAGVSISSLFLALTNLTVLTVDGGRAAGSILFWNMGSLGGATWEQLTWPFICLIGACLITLKNSRALDALSLGTEPAQTLGINVQKIRWLLLLTVALLTSVLVTLTGPIGFVGMIIPHVSKMLIGPLHQRSLPWGMLIGAVFLTWMDALSRTFFSPQELPIGVITAFIGAPFFVYLLKRRGQNET